MSRENPITISSLGRVFGKFPPLFHVLQNFSLKRVFLYLSTCSVLGKSYHNSLGRVFGKFPFLFLVLQKIPRKRFFLFSSTCSVLGKSNNYFFPVKSFWEVSLPNSCKTFPCEECGNFPQLHISRKLPPWAGGSFPGTLPEQAIFQ